MNYKQGTGNIATFLSHIEVKTIAKAILFCIIVGVFFLSHDERVWAGNHVKLYVDAAASPGGDGSKHAPFARITDAVNTARVIWQADNIANIEIRVEPGTYRGRYSNTNPNLENLPIVLDIPNLKLKGSTSMLVDDSGLPTGEFEPGKETLLKADPALVANQSLLIITRTDSVLTGQGVEVSKLIINVGYSTMPATVIGTGISVERVQDFTVRNNYVTGFGEAGIRTRAASGKIQGNYITELGAGTIILAGSTSSPASVLFSGNRSVNNRFGGVFLCGFAITDAGFNRLSAVVDGNDLSNSNISPVAHEGFGIRVAVVRHDPPNPGNSGNVTATISNNRISNNKIGFSIDAGFPYRIFGGSPDPRLHNGTLNLSLADNQITGNLTAPALISFTRNSGTLTPSQLPRWKYLEHSSFDITDPEGNLNGYWFDHPVTDPIDGRTLQNVLRINGNVIDNGRYVPFP